MFEAIVNLFYTFLYQPLFNLLVVFYSYLPGKDFGVAIIFLTLAIRVVLLPTSIKAARSQKALQKIQPQITEIQKKYKDEKEKQAKEMLAIYKREKINPFSGLFLALIQLPILIALYQVFRDGLKTESLSALYLFIANPQTIDPFFFNMVDLAKPNTIIAFLAGLTQYWQTKMLLPPKNKGGQNSSGQPDFSQLMQKQMTYFFPVITVVILFGLPSALGLYWAASGVFSIIQQYFTLKKD